MGYGDCGRAGAGGSRLRQHALQISQALADVLKHALQAHDLRDRVRVDVLHGDRPGGADDYGQAVLIDWFGEFEDQLVVTG